MTRQSGGSTLAFTRTPAGSLVSMRSGSNHFYYIFDALGSVIALTDGSGAIAASYTYRPYGTTLTASGAQAGVNPFRFASGYFDSATGLLKFGTRYYDPSLGRWSQRDSIAGSIADPNAMDRYVYAGDSPVNMTDESGADFSVSLGGSICAYLCFDFGATLAASGLYAYSGIGVGAAGADISLTASPAYASGQNSEIDCSVGGYTIGMTESGGIASAGVTTGAELGCAAYVNQSVQVFGF
jgi:RHS repeat-associated protein